MVDLPVTACVSELYGNDMALLSYLSQTLITFFFVMFPCNLQIASPLFDSSHLGGLPSGTQFDGCSNACRTREHYL